MNLEEVTKRYEGHPPIKFLLFGFIVSDGDFRIDCCACLSRDDARKESVRFVKFELFDVEKSKNQNL